jgi:FkbM family methyltransferase
MTREQIEAIKKKLTDQATAHLSNWKELMEGARAEKRGEPVGEEVVLKFYDGLELACVRGYGAFVILFPEIYVDKVYVPTKEFEIQPNWTIVDVGANLGFFTCQAARVAPTVRVVAVEPISVYVKKLRENTRRNKLDNVTVLHAATTAAPTSVPITIWYEKSGEPRVTEQVPPGARTEVEHAEGITLGEVFRRGNVEHCDLLKVDIEGGEYETFAGTPKSVWDRVDRLVMETHEIPGREPAEIVRLLEKQGFTTHHYRDRMLWATRRAA